MSAGKHSTPGGQLSPSMDHWSERVLADLSRSLGEEGVEIINKPPGRPERLESITLATLIGFSLRNGFAPADDRLDLSHTNHIPYRRVTQGSGVNQRAEISDILSWVSPIFEVVREQRSLSFFREGTPFLRSRDRPDLLVYPGTFDIDRRSDPFVGEHVTVSWEGECSGERRYKRETNANGPIAAEDQGDSLPPVLGMEVSLNKSCERLKEQLSLLRDLGCESVAALLEHENPCTAGETPPGTTVFNATDKQDFYTNMELIGTNSLQGVTNER